MIDRDRECKHRVPYDDRRPLCKAGVDYTQFKGDVLYDMPCLGRSWKKALRCPSYARFSYAELEQRARLMKERLLCIGRVRETIIKLAREEKRLSGTVKCPCCPGGLVSYRVVNFNGSLVVREAACSTRGCARWKE